MIVLRAFLVPTSRKWRPCGQPPFSPAENEVLVRLVGIYGTKLWTTIASHLPKPTPKQCRERWHYHLNPALNKGPWTLEEDQLLLTKHEEFGNKWAEIAKFLPGRTDSLVKSRWTSLRMAKKRDRDSQSKLELVPMMSMDFSTIPPLVQKDGKEQWEGV
jgi:hypothetical protein